MFLIVGSVHRSNSIYASWRTMRLEPMEKSILTFILCHEPRECFRATSCLSAVCHVCLKQMSLEKNSLHSKRWRRCHHARNLVHGWSVLPIPNNILFIRSIKCQSGCERWTCALNNLLYTPLWIWIASERMKYRFPQPNNWLEYIRWDLLGQNVKISYFLRHD